MSGGNDCPMAVGSPREGIRKKAFFLLRFAVSFGILYYLFTLIPIGRFVETLRSVNAWMVVLAILLTQVMTFISAMKSKILTDEHNLSLTIGYIFKVNYTTQFFGLFLPEILSSGVIRWHKLSKPDRKPAEAFASMILCRLTEIFIFLCLGLVFWYFDRSNTSSAFLGGVFAVCILFSVIGYYVIFNRSVSGFVARSIGRQKFLPRIVREKLDNVLAATAHYQGLKKTTFLRILALSILKDLFGVMSVYILALSVNIDIDFISIGWIRSFLLLFALLPISISNLGIQEGSLVYFLKSFGYAAQSALVLSLLLHLRRLIGGGIGGLLQAMEIIFPPQPKAEAGKAALRAE